MTRKILSVVVGVILVAAAVTAQKRPDFTGMWQTNREKTAAASPSAGSGGSGRMGGGAVVAGGAFVSSSGSAPAPWVVVQTATILTITRDFGDGSGQKWVYKLDGGESINTNARTTTTTRSRWDGDRLITEGSQVTKTQEAEVAGTVKEVRWLDKDGSMHVETTRAIGGREPSTTFQVFDKQPK